MNLHLFGQKPESYFKGHEWNVVRQYIHDIISKSYNIILKRDPISPYLWFQAFSVFVLAESLGLWPFLVPILVSVVCRFGSPVSSGNILGHYLRHEWNVWKHTTPPLSRIKSIPTNFQKIGWKGGFWARYLWAAIKDRFFFGLRVYLANLHFREWLWMGNLCNYRFRSPKSWSRVTLLIGRGMK